MADIGRSTKEHRDSKATHALDDVLESWGNWIRSVPAPHAIRSLAPSPAFRLYVTKYNASVRDTPRSQTGFDPVEAELLDRIIATIEYRLIFVLVSHYVARRSSRESARVVSAAGWRCSHTTYRRWLEEAKDELWAIVKEDV